MVHHIGLIVTGADACTDFRIFVQTLERFHPDAQLYVYTDTPTHARIAEIRTRLAMHCRIAMDAYIGLNRGTMEAMAGKYDSLFKDYCYEKTNVMEWMFEMQPTLEGAWFMDADISHLAPLPTIPSHASVALSPHYIRDADCRLYGKYNAGFLWIRSRELLNAWRDAAPTSRFFEQAALEYVAAVAAGGLYEFPPQVNFGWWRMYQASAAPPAIMAKFTIFRPDASVGVRYDGAALQSIHTHWSDRSSSTAGVFNAWFEQWTRPFARMHRPLAAFREAIGRA